MENKDWQQYAGGSGYEKRDFINHGCSFGCGASHRMFEQRESEHERQEHERQEHAGHGPQQDAK